MSHHSSLLSEEIAITNSDEIGELNSRITTNETNIIVANARSITNASNILFTDAIKFQTNGMYAYTVGGSNGNSQSSLSTTPIRLKLIRGDTYANNITLSNNDTCFTPSESGVYLSIISAEFADNGNDLKNAKLELIKLFGSGLSWGETTLQMVRGTFTNSTTQTEYHRLNNTMCVNLVAGTIYYYKATSNNNGGVIVSGLQPTGIDPNTNFTLIKIAKSF